MKNKIKLMVLVSVFIILGATVNPVKAYNHSPGVEVDDEIEFYQYTNDNHISSTKHIITDISDDGLETKISGIIAYTYQGGYVTDPGTPLLGTLVDYSENPEYLTTALYITNGTQIADYIDLFEANEVLGPGAVYESIYAGYGINCTKADGSTYIRRYSTFGVLSYWERNTSSGIQVVELHAINGDRYHQVGITTPVLITAFLVTVFAIVLFRRIKIKHKQK